jgi:outer membrane protein insertion porin family
MLKQNDRYRVSYKGLHFFVPWWLEPNQSTTRIGCFLFSIVVICLTLFSGCTGTKFLKKGESFYAGAEIKINTEIKVAGQKRVKSKLQELITPKPNPTILGSRPSVWFYYKAGIPKKKKGFKNFMKTKLGKPPVLVSDATPDKTATILQNQLNNDGYFKSTFSHEVNTTRKKSTVIYTVELERPFRLRKINYLSFDTTNKLLQKIIKEEMFLKERQRYQLDRLQAEQQRIEEVVENLGYYYFDDRYLLFEADSTVGGRKVDVDLKFEKGMPAQAMRLYRVKTINVYPNYSLTPDSSIVLNDTTNLKGYKYIDNKKKFRPEILVNVINLKPDSTYRRIDHEYTVSRLMSLKAFKFVNVKYYDIADDSSSLHANIYLTPLIKKSLRLQVQGVSKSNNFVGPGFEATFTNRNFFRGAEMFEFKLISAYESQISRQQSGALNAIEFGVEASLSVPRFIMPIYIPYRSAKYLPQTQFKLGYNFQQRLQYFRLTSFNVAYGYSWRETTLKTHELFPVEVSFVRSSKTSPEFDALLEQNPSLANSFQNQFLLGSRYSFTLNTQLSEDMEVKYKLRDNDNSHFYFNVSVDFSGNILNALQSMDNSTSESHEVLGSMYSQYSRGAIDFRYYLDFNRHSKLASRLAIGAGYAYGNSTNLPYIKQFAVGGSNSLRAFPARAIGPGTYNVRTDTAIATNTFFIDQRADSKLEVNVEYRFDIIKSLKGALFVDAGNIWLWREDEFRKGGKFEKDFLNELAVGTGFGLRYDFNFFVLRFDLAFPIRKPYLEQSNRWVLNKVNVGNKEWRKENLILNIAIGYPF